MWLLNTSSIVKQKILRYSFFAALLYIDFFLVLLRVVLRVFLAARD